MPELPEVETICRGLLPLVVGRRLLGARIRERRLREAVRSPELARLRGARVTGVRRRSKYLLIDTDAGETLLVHLGMTGRIWVADAGAAARPHEHVVIPLDDGRELRFADARRFGLLRVVRTDLLPRHRLLADLGPEPLDGALDPDALHRRTRGLTRPVKSFLLDTRAVAGIGNIYACEALCRAGLNPRRPVGRISEAAWARLVAALQAVLRDAIRAGGTTFRDFRNAEENAGYFAVSLRVYDREGEPCGLCGGKIRRIVQVGRSTFYCPRCQR